jgi:APA family basic amino acid/polyamine antiporter
MKKGLFAKKSIGALLKEAADTKHGLKRSLGPMNLTAMGIGAIIGAGLFIITGEVAAKYSGPAVVISFIIAAIICGFCALCYAEFASLIPIAGSAYTYAFVAIGEFFAWIMGVALTVEYLFSFCTVAVGWSGYLNSLLMDLGIPIHSTLSKAPLMYDTEAGWTMTGAYFNLPAIIIIVLLAWLISRGIQTAAFLNDLLVIMKLGVILLFIGFGIAYITGEHLTPFIPANTGVFGEYGWSGILRGAGIVFFAFLGFDAVATLAQEAKNPQRDMPIGMIAPLIISTVVYIAFAFVMTGVVDFRTLDVADPVGVAVHAFGPSFAWLSYIIKFAILAGLTSVILVMMTAQARIVYTMAHDGLVPKVFGKTHPTYRTPFFTTWVMAGFGVLLAGFFPINILGPLTSMGALFVFAMVCFGVLVLRFTQPTLHRPFKTPFTPWVPLLGTLGCVFLMILMPGVIWLQFIAFLGLGCLFYAGYGRKHSKIRNA